MKLLARSWSTWIQTCRNSSYSKSLSMDRKWWFLKLFCYGSVIAYLIWSLFVCASTSIHRLHLWVLDLLTLLIQHHWICRNVRACGSWIEQFSQRYRRKPRFWFPYLVGTSNIFLINESREPWIRHLLLFTFCLRASNQHLSIDSIDL